MNNDLVYMPRKRHIDIAFGGVLYESKDYGMSFHKVIDRGDNNVIDIARDVVLFDDGYVMVRREGGEWDSQFFESMPYYLLCERMENICLMGIHGGSIQFQIINNNLETIDLEFINVGDEPDLHGSTSITDNNGNDIFFNASSNNTFDGIFARYDGNLSAYTTDEISDIGTFDENNVYIIEGNDFKSFDGNLDGVTIKHTFDPGFEIIDSSSNENNFFVAMGDGNVISRDEEDLVFEPLDIEEPKRISLFNKRNKCTLNSSHDLFTWF